MNDRKLFKNNQLGKRASFSKGTYEQWKHPWKLKSAKLFIKQEEESYWE